MRPTHELRILNQVPPFDELPPESRIWIFGVEYARLDLDEGGELFVTRIGWSRLPALFPEKWHTDKRFSKDGQRLTGGTGNVFRLAAPCPKKPDLNLVVKVARSGQSVPLFVVDTFPGQVSDEEIKSARWNSPFEEFGLLEELRQGEFGPQDLKIRTKRPVAIYCPPHKYHGWQLGRSKPVWIQMEGALQNAQQCGTEEAIHLHPLRDYFMLFEWVDGINAEDAWEAGLITEKEMTDLTVRVIGELEAKGFRVLDNKPRHFILRQLPDGSMMRRGGKLVYVLIDFELMLRIHEYSDWLADKAAAKQA